MKTEQLVMVKLSLKLIFFLLLCFLCVPVSTTAEEYVIHPGDTISILVWGHEEYNQSITVRQDGKISYPFLGEIKVDGLTTIELSEKIQEELFKHLLKPQVTVIVTQPKKNEIFVLGQVNLPNQFRFDQDKLSLLKALSMAGGILDDTADSHNVKIIRDDSTSEIIDLEKLLAEHQQQSVFLFPGDVVYVPKQERVSVTGYVLTPGEYKTKSSVSVIQALALAGGPIQDTADLSNALLIRSTGEVINVKLNSDFWTNDNQDEGYILYPGDTLYVPNAYEVEEVNILGYLQKPGRYKIKRPITLFEALGLAGGIINVHEANLQKARIIRGNGKVERVDLSILRKPMLENLSNIGNVKLYPGDTLEIPRKRKFINWSLALTIVSVISIAYNMLR